MSGITSNALDFDQEDTGFEMNSLYSQNEEATFLLQTKEQAATEDEVQPQSTRLARTDNEKDDDPLLKVVDKIEDEVDVHTYEDLVPLEVKLALEDKVFGWSHLSSDIMGHVVFTVGAYGITFLFVTYVLGKPERMAELLFRFLRFLLSFWAGLSTFRMVRRRKRIWLRSAYGSKDYERDAFRRRQDVAETDRTTLLGRIRRRRAAMAERGHQKSLSRAVERFKKREQRRQRNVQQQSPSSPTSVCLLSDSETNLEMLYREAKATSSGRRSRRSFHAYPTDATQSIGQDQILFTSIHNMPYAHGGFFGAAPFMLANPHWIDVLRLLMPDVYIEISRRVVNAPAPKLIHWAENNPVVAAYGTAHELQNNGRVPNIEWDIFLDPHLVHRVEVVREERDKFLQTTAPSSYREIIDKRGTDETLKCAEELGMTAAQRSILAYYEAELRRRTLCLVDHMLIAHGNLTQLFLEQCGIGKKYNFSRVKRTRRTLGGGMYARQWLAVFAEALKLGMCLDSMVTGTESEDTDETRSLPSTPSTSDEESECAPKTPRCQCLQCAASELAVNESFHETGTKQDQGSCGGELAARQKRPIITRSNTNGPPLRSRTTSADVLASSKCLNTSIAESIALLKSITRCDTPVGLVFDVKSRHVPKHIWGLIVDALRDAGARVEGVASFTVEDIRDISSHTSTPVKEIYFFHSAGDMQLACHDGRIRHGDTVFFNAGSLIWEPHSSNDPGVVLLEPFKQVFQAFDPEEVKRNYRLLPFAQVTRGDETPLTDMVTSTIQQYKEEYNLSIGLYVQEFAIDEAAVNLLVRYVNGNPQIYNLGLSWGGVNGVTVHGIQPGRFTNTDGFWNQRYAGTCWEPFMVPGRNVQ